MRDLTKHPSTEDLAMAAFDANERVKALAIRNTPSDYDERKKAFMEFAAAREAAAYAEMKLEERIRGGVVGTKNS